MHPPATMNNTNNESLISGLQQAFRQLPFCYGGNSVKIQHSTIMRKTPAPKFMAYNIYSNFLKGTLKNDLNERDANVIRQFLEWAGRHQLITPAVAVAMDIEDTAIDAQSVDVNQQGAWLDIDSPSV
jgi:predicted phosphoadenosine phosphosulfate sulfurtransferase